MKKNNTAEKTVLKAQKISEALKEGTEKSLRNLMNEAISNIIKESDDFDEDENEEDVEDDSFEVEDVDTAETPEDNETPSDGEEQDPEVSDDTESDNDEWSDMEEYKVGDNDYDFTGVDGETALKVYNKLGDNDQIFVKQTGEGTYEVQDDETGAEFVIELNPEVDDADAEEQGDSFEFETDFEDETGDEEPEFDIEIGDEEPEDDGEEIEIDLGDENSDEDDNELNEENLGYTDSYQKDVFAKKPNMSEPGKNVNDWDEGAPKGAEKPWAGKGDMKPFGKKKELDECGINAEPELNEDGQGLNTKHAMKKSTNRLNKGAQNQHVASEEGDYKGQINEAKVQKIINAAKAILAENKDIRAKLAQTKKALYEAAVSNASMASVLDVIINETTTKEEKKQIAERFLGAKTLKEVKSINESVKRELNAKTGKTAIVEHQISMTPSLNETTIYTPKNNPSLDLMSRMDNLNWK